MRNLNMGIETNLKNLRKNSGLTQKQVAEKLNVTRQAVSSYESGRTQPDLDTIKRIADIYKVNISDIVYEYADNTSKSFKIIARAHYLVQVLLDVTLCCSKVFMNILYPMPVGSISSDQQYILERHMQISNWNMQIENIMLAESFAGALLLLGLVVTKSYKIGSSDYRKYGCSLICILLLVPFLCAILDPVFLIANYIFTPGVSAIITMVVMAVLSRMSR